MCNYQWQNQDLTEIQIPEILKKDVLTYAQRLDASSDQDIEIARLNASPHQNKDIAKIQRAIAGQSKAYGNQFREHLLEEYKVYLEMADRVSSRRLQTNGFFITIFSGLLAVIAFIFNKDTQLSESLQNVLLWGVVLSGFF